MAAAVVPTKKALRALIKTQVLGLSAQMRQREAQALARQITEHPVYTKASRIALFISMPDEISTAPIFAHAFKTGKQCFVPRYTADSMDMYRVSSMEDIESLPKTKWNVSQPEDIDARENALDSHLGLDLILMPGLAFDTNGERLGRGKGYYDTFLQRLAEGPSGDAAGRPENVRPKVPPYTIGIGFSVQLVDAIPTEPHDMKLDEVVLPTAATE